MAAAGSMASARPLIGDGLASCAGRLESFVLPHRYDHLAPLVDLIGLTARGAEKGAENADQRGEETPALPRPPYVSETPAINSSACAWSNYGFIAGRRRCCNNLRFVARL